MKGPRYALLLWWWEATFAYFFYFFKLPIMYIIKQAYEMVAAIEFLLWCTEFIVLSVHIVHQNEVNDVILSEKRYSFSGVYKGCSQPFKFF